MPEGGWLAGRRPDASQSQGAGWLWEPLLLLHHSCHPRPQPFSVARRPACATCRLSPTGGGTELVLSGINLGRWGRDLKPQRTLEELVSAILLQTALPRLRLSSIEPMDWTPELLALFRGPLRPAGWRAMHISRCNRDPTPFCAPCTAAIVPGTTRRNCA